MRLLVINTVHDPAFAHLRRQNPGKVLLRPVVAGRPLPSPGGRLILTSDMLTADVVAHLELLVSVGNARVVEMGARQATVSFDDVRARLRLPARVRGIPQDAIGIDEAAHFTEPPAPAPATPAVIPGPESAASPESSKAVPETLGEAILGHLQENDLTIMGGGIARAVLPITEIAPDVASVEPVLVALGAAPVPPPTAPVATPETWVRPDNLDDAIGAAKGDALRSALAVFGKSGAGKAKATMTAALDDLFASDDQDPVSKLKALEILRTAAQV